MMIRTQMFAVSLMVITAIELTAFFGAIGAAMGTMLVAFAVLMSKDLFTASKIKNAFARKS